MSKGKWLVFGVVVVALIVLSGWMLWRNTTPVAVPAVQVFAEGEGYFDEASGFALTYPDAWRPYRITAERTMDNKGVSVVQFVAHVGDRSTILYVVGVTPAAQWTADPCAGLETECAGNRTELGRNAGFVFDGGKMMRDPCDATINDADKVITDPAFCAMFAAMTDDVAKGRFMVPQK